MAQDFNIYIKSDQTSESHPTKPTQPSSQSETKPSSATDNISKAIGVISNPDSAISMGTSAIAKAVPQIAVAYAVVKLGTKVVSTVSQYSSMVGGDYRLTHDLENASAVVSAIFSPFSTGVNVFRTQTQYQLQNNKLSQYRELTGDSIINSYGKGV